MVNGAGNWLLNAERKVTGEKTVNRTWGDMSLNRDDNGMGRGWGWDISKQLLRKRLYNGEWHVEWQPEERRHQRCYAVADNRHMKKAGEPVWKRDGDERIHYRRYRSQKNGGDDGRIRLGLL